MNTSLMNQYTKNHYFYLATLYESVWYSLSDKIIFIFQEITKYSLPKSIYLL